MKDKDKKDTPLSKEEQELVNLVTTSVSSKMADTISDLVTKSLDIPDDDDNKDDDNKDDGKDKKDKADPAVNKQMDAILKGINYLITKDIKATKAAEAKTKKEAIEKTFQDAISAAVSKTLKEVGKISGGSKKKSKVNTKHQDDDDDDGDNSSLNPYTIDERTFKALTEAEQDEMVGECFKQQMGINALGELQKAAKQINRGTFNKDDDDE